MTKTCQQFINCSVLRNHKIAAGDLWIYDGKVVDPDKHFKQDDGRIVAPGEAFKQDNGRVIPSDEDFKVNDETVDDLYKDLKRDDWKADVIVDCGGAIIAPGFIDIQINGGFGFDFTTDIVDEESSKKILETVGKGILAHGVTSYCPTIVTSPKQVFHKILPCIRRNVGGVHGASVLGVHVEGPFISLEKRGAHARQHLNTPKDGLDTIRDVYGPGLDNVVILTLAPELHGALDVIEECTKNGIRISVGHSMADLGEGQKAVEKGATLVTHLFNGMKSFHHREPGLLGLFLQEEFVEDKVWFGIIVDGVHVHPLAVKLAYKVNFKSLIIITDAICAMGFKDGRYRSGQQDMEVRGDKALVAGTDILIGSVATMHNSVIKFKLFTGCTLAEALEAASLHPAKALGMEGKKGILEHGADADFVFLHAENLGVVSTWIRGEKVYDASL